MKLKAFIGSSSENLNISNALKHNLENELDCVVWNKDFYRLSRTTLQTLMSRVDDFDVGIFVFGADDSLLSRGQDYQVTRDNVIYEHGLFSGRLGPQRTFVVRSASLSLKWLTDLDGFCSAKYDDQLAARDG